MRINTFIDLFVKTKIYANIYQLLQGFDGGPPIQLKEEPEDGPRSMQKVPSLSDLSDPETSLGECTI